MTPRFLLSLDSQAKNEVQPCFVTYLLEHQEEYGLSDDELAYIAGSMFGAGSDTVCDAPMPVMVCLTTYSDCRCSRLPRDGSSEVSRNTE